jgi:hypothetical protein
MLDWPPVFLVGALAGVVLIFLAVIQWARNQGKCAMLTKPAPGPKWSFESWATTSTALGAVLGTVLASTVVPAVPRQISKDSLVALNLVFAGMVVVAPFLFQAIRRGDGAKVDQDAGLWGYNWALALACAITGGAVLGELATLALVGWEIAGAGFWGYLLLVAIIGLGLLAARYFVVTARELATTDWKELADEDKKRAAVGSEESLLLGPAGGKSAPGRETPAVVAPRRAWSLP